MTLQQRIGLLVQLGNYMLTNNTEWVEVQHRAAMQNPLFTPDFIVRASNAIASNFLQEKALLQWVDQYQVPDNNARPKLVGLVMAGNLPMVGFHDMLCIFISGNRQLIKLSAKDDVLIKHLVTVMSEWDEDVAQWINFADKLTGCDVYIATGSNNTGRYFDYYFGRYPNIIRRNRTSVAVISGNETDEELDKLADDIQTYFGLGCRNVTKLYVPVNYNFEPLLAALNKYADFADNHKYRHNYDYQLALLMMGGRKYMTNGTVLLSENPNLFTAISQVHYEHYADKSELIRSLQNNNEIQCMVGEGLTPFGKAQSPSLTDYADGVDTMAFLMNLNE